MEINFQELAPRDRYKLLCATIVPRPIALVTSLNADDQLNAAPFSFFNAMGSDPPLVVLGINNAEPGVPKHSAHNIRQTREFVINIVDEAMSEQMNICAVDFPSAVDETAMAGFVTVPSTAIKPPRIAAAPVSFECREHGTIEIGHTRIIIGEVLYLHIRDDLIDMEKLHVHTDQMRAIGRMHGSGWYARTTDLFQLTRLNYEEWKEGNNEIS